MKNKKRTCIFTIIALLIWCFGVTPEQSYTYAAANKTNVQKSPYKLQYIRFFESGNYIPDFNQRVYKQRFPVALTKYVSWEIGISMPESLTKKTLKLKEIYYNPNGTIFSSIISQNGDFFIDKGQTSANYSWGVGWENPGNWRLGIYKVDIWIDNYKVASGKFEVCDGNKNKKQLTTKDIAKKSNAVVLINVYDSNGKLVSLGSGFIVSADGKVVTNFHVIDKAQKIEIVTSNNAKYQLDKIIGYDSNKDIAVIKIKNAKALPYVVLGDSDIVELGEDVIAIGSPLGLSNTVSTGIISSIRPNIFRDAEYCKDIQISAPISHGSSGGALFNTYGEVIGVTYAGLDSIGGENLNFAIPINEVIPFIYMNGAYSLVQVYNKEHVIQYSNGDKYEGDLKKGVPDGYGVKTYADGSVYTGNWSNGLFNGEGTYSFASGSIYIGDFVNGKMSGQGIGKSYNGELYEGGWLDNSKNGIGKLSSPDMSAIYVGTWKNDKLNGSSIVYFNGNFYNIYWIDNNIYSIGGKIVDTTVVNSIPKSNTFNIVSFPLYLYSDEDKRVYLGKLTTNKYDSDSIYNEYGTYGNKYSSTSIWNENSTYGSEYSLYSSFNENALHPPLIVDSAGNMVGKLTVNSTTIGAIDPNNLISFLGYINQ